VVQAAWEVLLWLRGRWKGPSRRALASAIVLVGAGFVAVQLWPPATDAWRWSLGAVQWPIRAVVAVARGGTPGAIAPVQTVADAGDLLALPALAISWLAGRGRAERWEPPGPAEPPG
jgi:hypothetical protein